MLPELALVPIATVSVAAPPGGLRQQLTVKVVETSLVEADESSYMPKFSETPLRLQDKAACAMLDAPASKPKITMLRKGLTDDISKIGYDFSGFGNHQFQLARFPGHIQLGCIAPRREIFKVKIPVSDSA